MLLFSWGVASTACQPWRSSLPRSWRFMKNSTHWRRDEREEKGKYKDEGEGESDGGDEGGDEDDEDLVEVPNGARLVEHLAERAKEDVDCVLVVSILALLGQIGKRGRGGEETRTCS